MDETADISLNYRNYFRFRLTIIPTNCVIICVDYLISIHPSRWAYFKRAFHYIQFAINDLHITPHGVLQSVYFFFVFKLTPITLFPYTRSLRGLFSPLYGHMIWKFAVYIFLWLACVGYLSHFWERYTHIFLHNFFCSIHHARKKLASKFLVLKMKTFFSLKLLPNALPPTKKWWFR
jgi:hypothetical protein